MLTFFKQIFVWWNQQTLGTRIYTLLNGKFVGKDEFGNKYYENKKKNKRWIIYKDEIMYSLGNIIQNAISYSKKIVTVEINYLKTKVKIIIRDDGNGFSKDIIDKLGEPYISKNNQGMGLGIFISKNLIENMGGNLHFYNSKENNAVVEIVFDNSILSI